MGYICGLFLLSVFFFKTLGFELLITLGTRQNEDLGGLVGALSLIDIIHAVVKKLLMLNLDKLLYLLELF